MSIGKGMIPNFEVDYDNELMLIATCFYSKEYMDYIISKVSYDYFLVAEHRAIVWTFKYLANFNFEFKRQTFNASLGDYPVDEVYKINSNISDYLFNTVGKLVSDLDKITGFDEIDLLINKLTNDYIRVELLGNEAPGFIDLLVNRFNNVDDIYKYVTDIQMKVSSHIGTEMYTGKELLEHYDLVTKELKERGTIETGWVEFDRIFRGFVPGEMTVVAARTSMGKSVFALNVARKLIENDGCVVYFTLEMSIKAQVDRLLAAISGVELSTIHSDTMTDDKRTLVNNSREWLETRDIYFYGKRGSTILDIESAISKIVSQGKTPDVVIIDLARYLTDFQGDQKDTENAIMYLHTIAKRYNSHIIVIVQINRETEKRKNPRPRISDIKWSGAYEEVADDVLLLFRESYYDQDSEGCNEDIIEVIFGKQRDDEAGVSVTAYFEFTKNVSLINSTTKENAEMINTSRIVNGALNTTNNKTAVDSTPVEFSDLFKTYGVSDNID